MTQQDEQPPRAEHLLDKLLLNAKIDYVTLLTDGKQDLDGVRARVVWPQGYRGSRVTLHDPSADDLRCVLAQLGHRPVHELEVAVDFRPRPSVPPGERAAVLENVMKDLIARGLSPAGPGVNNQFRAFFHPTYKTQPFNLRLPPPRCQMLHGGRADDVQIKAYFKVTDQGEQLPERLRVARVEVRMAASVLSHHGIKTVKDLFDFRYRAKLSSYFCHVGGVRHRAPSRRLATIEQAMQTIDRARDQREWTRVGVGAFHRGGKRQASHVRLLRNVRLNNRIGQALLRLEREFKGVDPRAFGRKSPAKKAMRINDMAAQESPPYSYLDDPLTPPSTNSDESNRTPL